MFYLYDKYPDPVGDHIILPDPDLNYETYFWTFKAR